MGLNDFQEIAKRSMVLFFVIDCSGSMMGSKIGSVNTALEELLPELKNVQESNADAIIKLAFLKFADDASWINQEPLELSNCSFRDLDADGSTNFNAACNELNLKLSTKAFMNEKVGSYAPCIFLLSDGLANEDYQEALNTLRKNPWFKNAIKVAVAIGDDADKNMLCDFTGSSDFVMTVHNPKDLTNCIKLVSIRASQIASTSSVSSINSEFKIENESCMDTAKNKEIASIIKTEIKEDESYDEGQDDW